MSRHISSKELMNTINFKMFNKITYEEFHEEKALLFSGISRRSLVLIHRNSMTISKKTYSKIYCIDVLTGEIVSVVDTNGADKGVYYGNDKLTSLPLMRTFVADFKVYKSEYDLYTLRLVSDIEEIGICDIKKFEDKYHTMRKYQAEPYRYIDDKMHIKAWNGAIFYPDKLFLAKDMNYLSLLFESDSFSCGTFLIKFTGSKVKIFNNRFQVKVLNRFIDVDAAKFHISEDDELSGYALISCKKTKSGNIYCKAINLFLDSHRVTTIIKSKKEKSESNRADQKKREMEWAFAIAFLRFYAQKGLFTSIEAAHNVSVQCYQEFFKREDITEVDKIALDGILINHLNTYVYGKVSDTGVYELLDDVYKDEDGKLLYIEDSKYHAMYIVPLMSDYRFSVDYRIPSLSECSDIADEYYKNLVKTNGAEIPGVVSPIPTEQFMFFYDDEGRETNSLGIKLGLVIDLDNLDRIKESLCVRIDVSEV